MTIKPSFACLASLALASLLSLSTPSCAQSAQDEATTKEPATVLLVAGQSNADGRVSNADLPNSIKENGYRHCRWSYGSGDISGGGRFEPFWPRISKKGNSEKWGFDAVVYHCLDQKATQDFYVIKETLGGTAIDPSCNSTYGMHWSADPEYLADNKAADKGGKSLLKAFTDNIGACIDNELSKLPNGYKIKAFIWHQGESDKTKADNYYDNLKALVAYVRNYLAQKTGDSSYERLTFICGSFSSASRDRRQAVVDALLRLAQEDNNFHVVDASDASLLPDKIHFDAAGAELLGQRIYEKLIETTGIGNPE